MIERHELSADEAQIITGLEESHYIDLKSIDIEPSKLSETVSAFANTSGGEIFIGVDETTAGGVKARKWRGFADMEAANAHIAVIDSLLPLGQHYKATFLSCKGMSGLVLHILVFKTKDIIRATSGTAYIRRGAQKLPVKGDEAISRLKLDKGIISFEDNTIDVNSDIISNSSTIIDFMLSVIPTGEPSEWLQKQNLIVNSKPTAAGILLFGDEPQAVLPKRSAIKILRYKTRDDQGSRETLAFDPVTVEGCLYSQIKDAVKTTKDYIENMKKLGEKGLDEIIYPDETLHEIITNAVLHRDYSIAADIQVRIYDNRVEVESPGRLPGHITLSNILTEQSARNPKIVRLINKFPDAPNKDVGEGLNTAFDAMKKLRLKEPVIEERDYSVVVNIRHAKLASPHDTVMEYLADNSEITNRKGRELTGIRSENSMKNVFIALKNKGMIEPVPGKTTGGGSAWRKVASDPPEGTG